MQDPRSDSAADAETAPLDATGRPVAGRRTDRDRRPAASPAESSASAASAIDADRGEALRARTAPIDLGGRYRLLSEPSSGGMGAVAEALDSLLDRRVAVKFLGRFHGDSERASVVREARIMAALRHRSVCRVLEVVLDPPQGADLESWRPFIVMEWVAGKDLASAWRGLGFDDRLKLFEMVAEGVAAMHAAGLVHRDLKPSNILCDEQGVPVVIDFGLSARAGGAQDALGGTPGWSAPEQFDPGAAVGQSADVFALGVLFYHMLTDTAPFQGASVAEVLTKARQGDAPLPEVIVRGIAAPLQRIALVALDPDPAMRYPDAAAMLADIRRFKSGETVLARPRRLFARFGDEIERHLADISRWQQQGLATEEEVRAIRNGLRELQRPESPWILDSRRLSWSQVAIYLGGWLLILALTVGVWNTSELWSQRGPRLPWLVPMILAGAVTAAGLVLFWAGERRAALGFLFTSALAVPIAGWQLMRTRELLLPEEGMRELFGAGEIGLSHGQQLAIALSGLLLSILYRLRVPSSAFTLLVVLFGTWLAHAIGIRHFSEDGEAREVFGQIPRWLLLPALASVAAGVWFDARSNRPVASLVVNSDPRDGGPTLVTGISVAIIALSLSAYLVPEWFWLQSIAVDESGEKLREPTVVMRSSAFLAIGAILLVASLALGFRPTPLRDWCSRALRWIVPSFLILPIVWLELEDAAPGWGFWLAALGAVSLGLVSASAVLQWRPFLISGLLGLLDVFIRLFMRIDELVDESSAVKLGLMLGTAIAGIATMTLASYPDRTLRAIRRMAVRARAVRASGA
jgi:serine/threonine protein kinase